MTITSLEPREQEGMLLKTTQCMSHLGLHSVCLHQVVGQRNTAEEHLAMVNTIFKCRDPIPRSCDI